MASPEGAASHGAGDPLVQLLDLAHQAREARSRDELAFLLLNDSRRLLHYRQAALWLDGAGLRGLSGVLEPDLNAPYAQWLRKLCAHLHGANPASAAAAVVAIDRHQLPPALAAEWADWLPGEGLWLPVPGDAGQPPLGGLVLALDDPCPDAALPLLQEWLHVWAHCWRSLDRPRAWWQALLRHEPAPKSGATPPVRWRRRPVLIGLALLVLVLLPVRLTVLAPAELVAADAAVVRAPLDGVIERFQVQPNQAVTRGQALFNFDEAPIASRLDVARQALATAEMEYRQIAQIALADPRAKGQLAAVQGRIEERRAEAAFLDDQFQRSRVASPRDGIAIFDDPSEWEGRPVHTGERILRVVDPHQVEVEAWLPVGDALPLPAGAELKLYLAATPLDPVTATLRYIAHDAVQRPDGSYAYRVRARLNAPTEHRIGLKGTGRLQAGWVPLAYWVLRRPLAIVRQYLAV
ncbi:HlyD family efflux transporter periplasmic adaptor subunit [Roseateles sp.]|uniref:HlyD family efflux transporter periplasmic adaptor subunit n=1 Tax=Roseateles sp. TaxID=1971397 RepID=UPI003264D933